MVRNDQEAHGRVKHVACHMLPLVYSRIPRARELCPSSLKAASMGVAVKTSSRLGLLRQSRDWRNRSVSDAFRQFVHRVRKDHSRQERQEVGKYWGSTVLAVHVQMILPARVVGDSTRYFPMGRIALLACGPLNKTLMMPLLTSTLETY